jgi:hypothetical protein
LPFTNSNSTIKTFRHALSLDEVGDLCSFKTAITNYRLQHRSKFRPNYYHRTSPGTAPAKPGSGSSSASEQSQTTQYFNSDAVETGEPDVLEVWFAGCHTGNVYMLAQYDQQFK